MSRALLLTGTVGVGKTTVAEALAALLAARGEPHAWIDLDALRTGWPPPPGDRFGSTVMLRNLAAVSAVYRSAGHGSLVLAGVVESTADRDFVAGALGGALTVVRLVADLGVVRGRLRDRHRGDPEGLAWHLHRASELSAIQEAAAAEDVVLGADGDPSAVATRALRHWDVHSPV